MLAHFHGFWSATEQVVDRWAHGAPSLAAELDWDRRRRTAVLAADCRALGVPALAVVPATVFATATDADVLGWLYVSEGSTLGGAVIARRIAPLGLSVESFGPYPEGPGPMWKRFVTVADAWAGDDHGRVDAVATSAAASFAALEAWLAPLRRADCVA